MMKFIAIPFFLFPQYAKAEVCISNDTNHRYFFSAEAGGERVAKWLAPQETLCAKGSEKGLISVFENEDVFEGCSRSVPENGSDRLKKYAEFDRCRWGSHEK